MALIFLLSAQPDFDFVPDTWQGDPLSLLAHCLEYAVLALLLWMAARRTPLLAPRAWLAALLIALVYAASDEWHQAFVPGRVPDVRDWLADAAGALVALGLVTRLNARRRQAKSSQVVE
jgi:VanZ family protein